MLISWLFGSSSIHSFTLNSHPDNFQNNPRLYQINQLTFDCVLKHDSALKWVWFCLLSLFQCSCCITVYLFLNQVVRWNDENDSFDVLMALSLKWMKSLFQENLTSVASVNDLSVRECMTLACQMLNGPRGYQNRWLLIKDEWLPLFKCKWSRGYWNNDLFCQEWMSSACPRVNDLRGYWNKWPLVQNECLPLVQE